jgi:hypothetical protein
MSHRLFRMLKATREDPGYVVRHSPGKQHNGKSYEPQNHAGWSKVGPEIDVVHIAREACQRNKRDVDHDETDECDANKEVDGASPLSAAEYFRIQREAVHKCGRHCHTRQDRQRSHDEHGGKVGKLLQGVVAVKAVWFRRKVEISINNKGAPGLHEHTWGTGHQPFPLGADKKSDDKKMPVKTKQ